MNMHALMVLFDSDLRDEVFMLMELTETKNYTHFVGLQGSSERGKKEGTVSWPGSNEILLLILSEEQKERFRQSVSKFKEERDSPPAVLVFNWPLQELV